MNIFFRKNAWFILTLLLFFTSCAKHSKLISSDKLKNWIWISPNQNDTDEALNAKFKKYHDAGITGVLFESDSERHFRAAKAQGLIAYRWIWTMNNSEALKEHPDWSAISRNGKSCVTNPPYVGYYRWMCPSNPKVQAYIIDEVKKELSKDYIDGINLDYVRYCDGILPVDLWKNYNIEQTRELPQYDFCYCPLCKADYKKIWKQDVDSMKYPEESPSWRAFRYDAVTNIVRQVAKVCKQFHKAITADGFPTPDIAKKMVKQDWANWPLDAFYPEVYSSFYKESNQWIGQAVKEGVQTVHGKFPIYAGLYIPDFKTAKEFKQGYLDAIRNGAAGVSLFGTPTDDQLKILSQYKLKSDIPPAI